MEACSQVPAITSSGSVKYGPKLKEIKIVFVEATMRHQALIDNLKEKHNPIIFFNL